MRSAEEMAAIADGEQFKQQQRASEKPEPTEMVSVVGREDGVLLVNRGGSITPATNGTTAGLGVGETVAQGEGTYLEVISPEPFTPAYPLFPLVVQRRRSGKGYWCVLISHLETIPSVSPTVNRQSYYLVVFKEGGGYEGVELLSNEPQEVGTQPLCSFGSAQDWSNFENGTYVCGQSGSYRAQRYGGIITPIGKNIAVTIEQGRSLGDVFLAGSPEFLTIRESQTYRSNFVFDGSLTALESSLPLVAREQDRGQLGQSPVVLIDFTAPSIVLGWRDLEVGLDNEEASPRLMFSGGSYWKTVPGTSIFNFDWTGEIGINRFDHEIGGAFEYSVVNTEFSEHGAMQYAIDNLLPPEKSVTGKSASLGSPVANTQSGDYSGLLRISDTIHTRPTSLKLEEP